MDPKKCTVFLLVSLFCLGSVFAQAADATRDPNTNIRKLISTGMDPALVEFERVKRLNNDAAIAHYTTLIQKNPKDATLYAKRGKTYGYNKDYDKAMADYNQALKLDPKLADIYVGRAVAYYVKRDYDKSWEDVHKAESLGGKFWPAFMDALKKSSNREK